MNVYCLISRFGVPEDDPIPPIFRLHSVYSNKEAAEDALEKYQPKKASWTTYNIEVKELKDIA